MSKTTNQLYTLRDTGMLQRGRDSAYNQLILSLDSFLQRVNGNIWTVTGLATGNASVAYIQFVDSGGTRKGYVGDSSGADGSIYLVSDSAGLIFGAIGSAITAMDTAKLYPVTTSAIDLGGSSNTWQHVYAEGIQFPATQVASANANNLDDYEEGSWTPAATFATPGNLSVTYSSRIGVYNKVGKSLNIFFSFETSAFTHTTASGQFQVTGVPFTAASSEGAAPGFCSGWTPGADSQVGMLLAGTAFLFYFWNNATGAASILTTTHAASGVNKALYLALGGITA